MPGGGAGFIHASHALLNRQKSREAYAAGFLPLIKANCQDCFVGPTDVFEA